MPIGKIVSYEKRSFGEENKSQSSLETNNSSITKEEETITESVDDATDDVVEVVQNGSEGAQRQRSRVQPFEDVADIFQTSNLSLKRGESVMDVEIKLAKEKENEWRRNKGLCERMNSETKDIIVFLLENQETEDGETSLKKLPPYREEAIKRLSERRLETEFMENKKRELDLINEGKIQSLSKGIIIEAIEKPTYRKSEYSKEELQGVSLMVLKSMYHENAWKEVEACPKDEEELKSCKIERSRSLFIELENLTKEHNFEKEKIKHAKIKNVDQINLTSLQDKDVSNDTTIGTPLPSIRSSKNVEKREEVQLDFSKGNVEKMKNNLLETSKAGNDQKASEQSEEKSIYRNKNGFKDTSSVPEKTQVTKKVLVSKTEDDLKAEKKKVEKRSSLGPGRFARVVRHGDTENMIAKEIEASKKRELELQKLRLIIAEDFIQKE